MAKKTATNKPVQALFHIVLEIGVDMGSIPLEQALEAARKMDVPDILDLSGVEYNDSSIEVSGVFSNG